MIVTHHPWQPMETMPLEGQVIVCWSNQDFDTIGRAEYLEIMGYGEPPAFGWVHLPEPLTAPAALSDATPPIFPIPLNARQEQTAKEWAADDRLWTTQETVEFNLRTFARTILAAASDATPREDQDD